MKFDLRLLIDHQGMHHSGVAVAVSVLDDVAVRVKVGCGVLLRVSVLEDVAVVLRLRVGVTVRDAETVRLGVETAMVCM